MTKRTIRLEGVIEGSPRASLICIDDGTTWRLVTEGHLEAMVGRAGIMEGINQGAPIEA